MVDACRVGICSLYDSGAGTFGLIVGVALGAGLILLIQYLRRRR